MGRWLLLAAVGLSLSGCGTTLYYARSVEGHVDILEAARPIDDWLADPATPPALRQRLEQVKEIRQFASRELDLPDNDSYRSYADLHRPFAVWNVFATPRYSLELKHWCFPVAGCVGYRGYYNRDDARHYADELAGEGWDVEVAGVPAYSTLGWTADPVLSTFINYPEGEVARLIFHELAHQKVYAPGDTTFNESYATTVEEVGVRRWLAAQHDPALTERYERFDARRRRFLVLLRAARERLVNAYAMDTDDAARARDKAATFAALRLDYEHAKSTPGDPLYQYRGYDGYFDQPLNNAYLASIATYTQRGPAFVKLLADVGGDLPRFFKAVQALADLPPEARTARLDALQNGASTSAGLKPETRWPTPSTTKPAG